MRSRSHEHDFNGPVELPSFGVVFAAGRRVRLDWLGFAPARRRRDTAFEKMFEFTLIWAVRKIC